MRNSFLVSAKLKKIPGTPIVYGHLIEELFGEGGFAACGRADEEVKAGPDAVEARLKLAKPVSQPADFLYPCSLC